MGMLHHQCRGRRVFIFCVASTGSGWGSWSNEGEKEKDGDCIFAVLVGFFVSNPASRHFLCSHHWNRS